MKIAQVAPLAESVPPRFYGGTERIVSYLTEALVGLGHDVTLFASGDSRTAAKLEAPTPTALRLREPPVLFHDAYHLPMLDTIRRRSHEFDVIHFHLDLLPLPLLDTLHCPAMFTLHGRQDLPDLWPCYERFPQARFASISDHQRLPVPPRDWLGTVHHGLPADLLPFSPEPEGYLAFLGRISPEKRPDRAIRIAVATGRHLKIAAKVDRADQTYWEEEIEPLIRAHSDVVEYVGEIDEAGKRTFLAGADALLFPIDWPEPFGLVMIEAMSAGTPVLAMRCGSVPEVIDHGLSGWIHDGTDEMIETVRHRLPLLDRATVRATFERRFTAERMATDYLALYERMAARHVVPAPAPDASPAAVAAE